MAGKQAPGNFLPLTEADQVFFESSSSCPIGRELQPLMAAAQFF